MASSNSYADPRAEQWMRHMRQGDFEAAWHVSDDVLRSWSAVPHPACPLEGTPVWRGESLDGRRVLVRCQHGLGDTIQFVRYAPVLRALAREVIAAPQPPLASLLQHAHGIDRIVLPDECDDVDCDVDVEVMEFPYIFRTTVSTVPCTIPYIHVAPAERARIEGLEVGLVWSAGDWYRWRSMHCSDVLPLADIPGTTLHILQRGPALAERPDGFGMLSGHDDFLELARLIGTLDLVIACDTMIVHLAGALGVPVWVILHARADWRWLEGRADSPWYPTVRLFRQEVEGDWASVVRRVAGELRERARTKVLAAAA